MKLGFCRRSKILIAFSLVLLSILAVAIVNAQIEASTDVADLSRSYQTIGSYSYTQYYNPSFSSTAGYISPRYYWPEFDRETCKERQDFIVQVVPGGCEPAVVRSDLLEEQPVPVFCKLMLIQTNPLIDVSRVKSIVFQGKYPEGVYDAGYFPSRYNVETSSRNLADTPIDDNMGYFVVVLQRYKSEKEMPDWIGGNLTAVINYDVESALGIGKTSFYVSEMNSEDWLRDYKEYSFWNGKGYIKTDSIEQDRVTVSVYRDFDTKQATLTLKKGETSSVIYLSGWYCAAGLKVRVEDIKVPVETALLQIDDQQVWVAKGDKIIDEKCSITEVDAYAGGGKVSISCPVQDGRFDLVLSPGKIKLQIGEEKDKLGVEQEYSIGSEIKDNIYLGYVGMLQEDKGEDKEKFAVFVSDPFSESETEFQDKKVYSVVEKIVNDKGNVGKSLSDELKKKIKDAIVNEYNRNLRSQQTSDGESKNKNQQMNETCIYILSYKDKAENEATVINSCEIKDNKAIVNESKKYYINLSDIEVIKNREWKEGEETAKEYYDKAIKSYRDLVDFYPSEKRINEDYFETYAAEGLFEAAKLARDFGMLEDRNEFLSRLRREYPDSEYLNLAGQESLRENKYDSRQGKAVVNFRERSYIVEVLDFKKPNEDELSANFLINGKEETLGLDEVFSLDKGTIQVTEIEDNYVKLNYNKARDDTTKNLETKLIQLDLDKHKQENLDETTVKLSKINLKKQAKLVLDSEVKGPRALANFSFKIGIEKRGIKLSPEKTKEMIENLGESIEKWQNVNEKLGKVVKGLKGACFATSALLTVKNLFDGFSGKSMARKEVMTRTGGWNDFCEKEVSNGKYASVQACLLQKNSAIEKDIEISAKNIEETNKILEQARQGLVERDFLDFEGYVKDREAMESKYRELVKTDCEAASKEIGLYDKYNKFCAEGNLDDIMNLVNWHKTSQDSGLSQVSADAIKNESARTAKSIQTNFEWRQAREAAETEVTNLRLGVRETILEGDNIVLANIKETTQSDLDDAYKNFGLSKGDSVMRVFIPKAESFGGQIKEFKSDVAGDYAIVKLKKDDKGIYTFDKAYTSKGVSGDDITKDVQNYLGLKKATRFKKSDAKAYQNKMLNPGKLQVKYFDRVPYKGLPAEVPFDVENGWYVEMEYVLSGFGKPYDESGRAVNYYICNVGENGLIEFKRKADDICRYYNGVSEELGFPGMSLSESRSLVARARNAIAEAIRYYGKKEAVIEGNKFSTGISFGGEAGSCSDFMSPQDCHIMFNLCDPVICPSSRCDLGGAFPVDNVIQTGIIGSLVLCLPNIKEGILIPVCLSGVHAGIESYVSILEAHKACLNESLETGRQIGICDEIRSIYTCEFFWRQLVPFADVLIPKLIESFFKQGVRGGGEYATVQAAWDNTQSAIDYFKNEYAVNSMKAFNMRSTEEAGTEVCKAFISARYPTDFDLLTEPDSPVQYHAWFDENVLTTATPYPTSHYKVYYHIYAGKDQGVYYYVYLKDIAEEYLSYYMRSPGRYVVASGYLNRGENADEARDFTAPSGYKQLCVNINGQDECDFGKVSTSFAVDYISDQYAAEQAQENIKTSKECVAGTPSLLSMAQPNLQAGAEEVVEPELYNQGIVRVCSTYNPGKQVDAKGEYDTTNSTFDRWKDVGYCDDSTIRCWLDTDSVKDVIKNKELEEGVLEEVDTSIIDKVDYLTYGESREIANEAEKLLDPQAKDNKLSISKEETKAEIENKIKEYVNELTKLANYGPSNSLRARGLFLLGRLYEEVAKKIKGEEKAAGTNGGAGTTTQTPTEETFTLSGDKILKSGKETGLLIQDNKIILKGKENPIIGNVEESIFKFKFDDYYVKTYFEDDPDIRALANKLEGATISGSEIILKKT